MVLTEAQRSCFRQWATVISIALGGLPAAADTTNSNNPPNDPRAIVNAMIGRDLKALGRYTGWNEIEYQTLFESYPPYEITRSKNAKGLWEENESVPTFGNCAQKLIVNNIKVLDVLRAPNPLSPIDRPKAAPNEVLVVVEADVLAIDLRELDVIPEQERCSWLGLQVQNAKTGKRESYFDNVDDDRALLKMMKQFGTMKGNYVVIEPQRRRWRYAVSMRLPFTGKGLQRHYDKTGESGQHKFVDAIEPRWLIQDPYPPEAWHIKTAIEQELIAIDNTKMSALRNCRFELSDALGIASGKVGPNLDNPICKRSQSVNKELNAAQLRVDRLKILKDLELGSK